jgi:hypothetical protein
MRFCINILFWRYVYNTSGRTLTTWTKRKGSLFVIGEMACHFLIVTFIKQYVLSTVTDAIHSFSYSILTTVFMR